MITYAVEPFAKVYPEIKEILRMHWAELAKNKQIMKLDVDEDYYEEKNRSGQIIWVVAREAGTVIGYVVWTLREHPHYKSVLCGQNDVHYLHPEHRQGWNGYNLLKEAISILRGLGVQYCYLSEKIGHEHPAIMKRLGFAPLDITYSCDLTRNTK